MKIEVDFPVITTGLAPRNKGRKPVVARRTISFPDFLGLNPE
jgi:hypothetical protein